MSAQSIRNFIANNMLNQAQNINSNKDFKRFNDKLDVNAFFLFSEKKKVPPMFKALSTQFKDKIKFAFIQESNVPKAEDEFDVEDYPSLILVQDFDKEGNRIERNVMRYTGEQEFEPLKEFLSEFVIEGKKATKKQAKEQTRD